MGVFKTGLVKSHILHGMFAYFHCKNMVPVLSTDSCHDIFNNTPFFNWSYYRPLSTNPYKTTFREDELVACQAK